MRILSNSTKFSAGRPLLPAYIIFMPQWPVPQALIVYNNNNNTAFI